MSTRKTGTKEWSDKTVNCVNGCAHNCRYCFARAMAERFARTPAGGWQNEIVRKADVDKIHPKYKGVVMFPSTHDITPTTYDSCNAVLTKLLFVGNQVLIVTKPHLKCIQKLCADLLPWRDQMMFRFTIGSEKNWFLSYWEPGAPPFEERLESLKWAHTQRYKTSVSIEPMLTPPSIDDLVAAVKPFVTDSIWIGKMNKIRQRVKIVTPLDESRISWLENEQTDEKIREIYNRLKGEPLIQWKDSIKQVVGL